MCCFNIRDKFAEYTDPDVRDWTQRVFAHAIENNNSIIFEGTMRTNAVCETIKKLQSKGYYINIQALAVPELDSLLSIYGRYEQQIEYDNVARFVSRNSHDAAYKGMLDTLGQIEREKLYDHLSVYTRNSDVLFESYVNSPRTGVVDAVVEYRNKIWGKTKYNSYINKIEELKTRIEKRNGNVNHIKGLDSLKTEAQKMTVVGAKKELSGLLASIINNKKIKE